MQPVLKLCCASGAGQLRGGQTCADSKNAELLGAIRQAKDMLGQGPMLAGVQAKSINSGELRAPSYLQCHPQCVLVGPIGLHTS